MSGSAPLHLSESWHTLLESLLPQSTNTMGFASGIGFIFKPSSIGYALSLKRFD